MCALLYFEGNAIFIEWIFFATTTLAGLLIGSFLNVVIHRGPAMWGLVERKNHRTGDLIAPRSYCPICGTPIARRHLAPLISYFMLQGRCAACSAPIPIRYPLVEVLGAAAALAASLAFGFTISAILAAAFLFCLIALAAIDLESGYLPDAITLPLLGLGLLANFGGEFVPFADAVIGAAAGYIAFSLIRLIYAAVRGREGLGQGDAKLLAAMGAWVGWQALPAAIFLASAASLAIILAIRLAGRKIDATTALPFGPGLCLGGAIALFGTQMDLSAVLSAYPAG